MILVFLLTCPLNCKETSHETMVMPQSYIKVFKNSKQVTQANYINNKLLISISNQLLSKIAACGGHISSYGIPSFPFSWACIAFGGIIHVSK